MLSRLLSCCCLLVVIGNALPARAAESKPTWKAGNLWLVDVDIVQRADAEDKNEKSARFQMEVIVTGTDRVGASQCWLVLFRPRKGAPFSMGQPYIVFVDQETGWPRKLARANEDAIPEAVIVQRFAHVTTVTGAPHGFPLEIMPLFESRDIKVEGYPVSLSLRKRDEGKQTIFEARVTFEGKEELLIRQRWTEGQPWWDEYERYVNGRKDLFARRTGFVPHKETPPKPKKVEAPSALGEQPNDPFHLRRDPRLQKKVRLVGGNLSIGDILRAVEAATGVSFEVDSGLAGHAPDLGSVQMRDAPAYTVLEMVAQRQLENGRWAKSEKGYRLTGNSLVPTPAGDSAWLIVWWVLAGVVVLATLYVLRRRLARKDKLATAAAK